MDDDLFAGTAEALGVDFDAVVTAEQVGSYKPSLRNFNAAARRMGVEAPRWLHVAESLYHDIAPANRLGIACVWGRPARRIGRRDATHGRRSRSRRPRSGDACADDVSGMTAVRIMIGENISNMVLMNSLFSGMGRAATCGGAERDEDETR